jgi:hypothetical protein
MRGLEPKWIKRITRLSHQVGGLKTNAKQQGSAIRAQYSRIDRIEAKADAALVWIASFSITVFIFWLVG